MLADFQLIEDENAEYVRRVHGFGCCPICHREPLILNVGREQYGTCPEHFVAWDIGSNILSGWRDESPEIWAANRELLATYWVVDESCDCPLDENGEPE